MAIFTWTSNNGSLKNDSVRLRDGALVLNRGSYADLTQSEVNTMQALGAVLVPGIVDGSQIAGVSTVPGPIQQAVSDYLKTNPVTTAAAQTYYGSGAPADTLGRDGDSYVDTVNMRRYGPKASGSWPGSYLDLAARSLRDAPLVGGTYVASAGTTSADNPDDIVQRKLVTAAGTSTSFYYQLASAIDVRGKIVKLPVRLSAITGWSTIYLQLFTAANFSGAQKLWNIGGAIAAGAYVRPGQTTMLSVPAEGMFNNGGTPDLSQIRSIGLTLQDSGASQSAWLGAPIIVPGD